MDQRLQLQTLLEDLLGSRNVYFQPPVSVKIQYPCIVYNREAVDTNYANDKPYKHRKRYQVTVIDRDPDSEIPDRISQLSLCQHNRFFVSDGLNHDVFSLYF